MLDCVDTEALLHGKRVYARPVATSASTRAGFRSAVLGESAINGAVRRFHGGTGLDEMAPFLGRRTWAATFCASYTCVLPSIASRGDRTGR